MVTELYGHACAKINLFLRVTGRRSDGYHELDSIFLPLAIADEIRLEIRSSGEPKVTITCNLPELERSKDNLAVRAAQSFMSEFDLAADVSLDLEKRIPKTTAYFYDDVHFTEKGCRRIADILFNYLRNAPPFSRKIGAR